MSDAKLINVLILQFICFLQKDMYIIRKCLVVELITASIFIIADITIVSFLKHNKYC